MTTSRRKECVRLAAACQSRERLVLRIVLTVVVGVLEITLSDFKLIDQMFLSETDTQVEKTTTIEKDIRSPYWEK